MPDANDQSNGNVRDQADIRVGVSAPNQPARLKTIHRDNLHTLLAHRTPVGEKIEEHDQMRRAAYDFCNAILAIAPFCPDQQNALIKVREALFLAHAAITSEGKH